MVIFMKNYLTISSGRVENVYLKKRLSGSWKG